MKITTICIDNLKEILHLLSQINTPYYTKKLAYLSHASIGEHIRHIVEFYQTAIYQTNVINYDQRQRQHKLSENISFCLSEIEKLILSLSSKKNNTQISLTTDWGEIQTTYERELLYCLEHSIHHQALIKVGLKELDLIHLVKNEFGVAPSTLKHRQSLTS